MSRVSQKFYITTPIYYVNDVPHIGHAYTTIAADIIARYHRMVGDKVRFLAGVDENAQKNAESAVKKCEILGIRCQDVRSTVQQYVDEMAAKWQKTWDELDISNDDFIRTTEPRHVKFVQQFWKKVSKNGAIYKGTYEGLYCTGCESYKTEADLVDGFCPDHRRAPEKLREENYFFRLSRYRKALLEHIKIHPEFIQPEARRNEVIAYLKDHAKDFSISRKNLEWGIPVPGDPSQTIYVWFDALINYISADKKWWPADLHIVGKEIIKFHCAYWPAMLLSAGLPLPRHVLAHGWLTIDGQKMSKSLGNVIDPVKLATTYGNDVLRFYLFRDVIFGSDGDFSEARLKERYEGELANGIGNLVARVLAMVEKYAAGRVPKAGHASPLVPHNTFLTEYELHMASFNLDRALNTIWEFINALDMLIDRTQPWKLAKQDDKATLDAVLYTLVESLRQITWMLLPFMPETAHNMLNQLGIGKTELTRKYEQATKWGGLKAGVKIKRGESLFPRLT